MIVKQLEFCLCCPAPRARVVFFLKTIERGARSWCTVMRIPVHCLMIVFNAMVFAFVGWWEPLCIIDMFANLVRTMLQFWQHNGPTPSMRILVHVAQFCRCARNRWSHNFQFLMLISACLLMQLLMKLLGNGADLGSASERKSDRLGRTFLFATWRALEFQIMYTSFGKTCVA